MIKNGIGGANTKTGAVFEMKWNLPDYFRNLKGYYIEENDKINVTCSRWLVKFQKEMGYGKDKNTCLETVAEIFQKHGLYRYFEEIKYDWKRVLSSKLLPDDSIFVISNNTVFIIEKKSQEVQGSVDEKLQTCDFKLKQYKKLFSPLNKEVQYSYILNKTFFENDKYKDVKDYIISVGCKWYYEYIPLKELGLPQPLE